MDVTEAYAHSFLGPDSAACLQPNIFVVMLVLSTSNTHNAPIRHLIAMKEGINVASNCPACVVDMGFRTS